MHLQLTAALRASAACVALCCGFSLPVAAQTTAQKPASATELSALARGWSLLAQKDVVSAGRVADELRTKYPRSAAAIAFAIDVEIARGGPGAALDTYERWLGSRTVEEAYVLRRVAHALLRSAARNEPDRARRLEALEALVADGDDVSDLVALAGEPDPFVRALAGDPKAIDALAAQLEHPGPAKRSAIAALGRTRNPRAVAPVVALLDDADPIVRTTAAEALGHLAAKEAAPQLRALLNDSVFTVKFAAANALAAMNDPAALPVMEELLRSEYPTIRVAAARATRAIPTPEWIESVRALTNDQDPDVRRQAAELIAPHDPTLARNVLNALLTDDNPAMRQGAADSLPAALPGDPAALRRLLRHADAVPRIRAAARLLELTR